MGLFITIATVVIVCAAVLYFLLKPRRAAKTTFPSFVWLLKAPRNYSLETVRSTVESALKIKMGTDPHRDLNAVFPAPDQPGASMVAIKIGDVILGLIIAQIPYSRDIARDAGSITHVQCRKGFQEHTAWISIDVMAESASPEEAVPLMAPIIAAFSGPDCLVLYCTHTKQMVHFNSKVVAALKSPNPLSAFDEIHADPIVNVAPKNEDAMAAAEAEARRRFPEFLTAFKARKRGDGFAVKIAFRHAGKVEHMWVDVRSIEGDTLSGILANDPQTLTHMKIRMPLSVKRADIEDWMIQRGAQTLGGFTAAVLQSQMQE